MQNIGTAGLFPLGGSDCKLATLLICCVDHLCCLHCPLSLCGTLK